MRVARASLLDQFSSFLGWSLEEGVAEPQSKLWSALKMAVLNFLRVRWRPYVDEDNLLPGSAALPPPQYPEQELDYYFLSFYTGERIHYSVHLTFLVTGFVVPDYYFYRSSSLPVRMILPSFEEDELVWRRWNQLVESAMMRRVVLRVFRSRRVAEEIAIDSAIARRLGMAVSLEPRSR